MLQNEMKNDLKYSLPQKPDEYFLPDSDDGSWYHQSQLDEQEQEQT